MAQFLSLFSLLLVPLPLFVPLARTPRFRASLAGLIHAYSLSYAAAIVALWICSNFSLWIFVFLWIGTLGTLPVLWASGRLAPASPPRSFTREDHLLCVGTGLIFVLRVAPLFVNIFPHGWDPYFHLILAEGVVEKGRMIHDWLPFEDLPINYPLGSHILLALVSSVARVPVHYVFGAAQVIFGVLLPLQLYALAVHVFPRKAIGLFAALIFASWAVYGGLAYFEWGGLPNLLAFYLLVTALTSVAAGEGRDQTSRWEVPVCFLALSFVHHHVMLTAFLIFGWLVLWARWVRPDPPLFRRLLRHGWITALLGSPYFAVYLARIPSLGKTGSISYVEQTITLPLYYEYFGALFFVSLLAGFAAYVLVLRKANPVRENIWFQALCVLLVLFVCLDYGYRFAALVLSGKEITPLAPGRFLTDAICLLCIFPALTLEYLRSKWKLSLEIVTCAILGLSALNWETYRGFFVQHLTPERLAAYAWIKASTKADAIVLDRYVDVSYFTRRASNTFPLTPSEYVSEAKVQPAIDALLNGEMPAEFRRRQIIGVSYDERESRKILWRAPGVALVELNAGEE